MSSGNINHEVFDKHLTAAVTFAKEMQHEYTTSEHMLLVMLEDYQVVEIIEQCGADVDAIKGQLRQYVAAGNAPAQSQLAERGRLTNVLRMILQNSIKLALVTGRPDQRGQYKVLNQHILLAIMNERDNPSNFILQKHGVTPLKLKEYAIEQQDEADEQADPSVVFIDPRMIPGLQGQQPQQGGKMTEKRAKKVLEEYTTLLNEEARNARIDPLIGREKEVRETSKIISRRRKNNVLLVGEPGVGKTAIAEGLASLIDAGTIPEVLKDAQVYSLDLGSLMAGTRYRGDFEERIKEVLKALEFLGEKKNVKTILFIDEIHMMMGAGAGGEAKSMDLANLLKPYLAKGTLRCIGSTTNEEYRKHFEKDRALVRRFLKIDVYEPSQEDTFRILQGLAKSYEEFHGLTYTEEALRAAVKLSSQHITNRFQPDKSIDVIDSAGAHQRIVPADVRLTTIDVEQIEQEVGQMTNRPVQVKADDKDILKSLEPSLRGVIYGQDKAIDTLVDSVYIARAGLRDPNKPEGSYLFVGPTGVGKTEVAKKLASTLGVHFERIDMSEYMEPHSVAKLIGSPPGYVGYDENGGRLITAVEEHPHMVLLLDEIEKAHPDIYNILLQVMDNGKLTNSHGKVANFKNVTLIMTSNAGARDAAKGSIGFGRKERDDTKQDEAVKRAFAPEFINRLDAIVPFDALSKENIILVVSKFLNELNLMTIDSNVTIEADEVAQQWLADKGFDPEMGARPLARVIHNSIKRPISREMLFGKLVNGGHVKVSVVGDELAFTYNVPATMDDLVPAE